MLETTLTGDSCWIRSAANLSLASLGEINDVFERTLLWGSLWDSVREAEMDPREYIDLALRDLPAEKDESLAQSIIGRAILALHWLM